MTTNTNREPKFLVVGNVMEETVTTEDGRTRQQVGGVGGIMARELARAEANVTLLAPVTPTQQERLNEALTTLGLTAILADGRPPAIREGTARISVRNGEPTATKGHFPVPGSIAQEIRDIRKDYDMVLCSLYLDVNDLSALAGTGGNIIANATTKGMVPRLGRMRGITAATMNQAELQALARRMRFDPDDNPAQKMGISRIFVTEGANGRTDFWMNGNRRHLPAIRVPTGADFIGAGDALTAGYAFAIANGLSTDQTMDKFLEKLLDYNAASYQ